VVVNFDALPGDTLRGAVTAVGASVSPANRTLSVEIVAPNPFDKLKPDMVAKVRMVRQANLKAVLVSENIVQLVDRDRHVVYVEVDGKAVERKVTLGGRQGNSVEVTDGLREGDHLIVAGFQQLVDGSPVVIVP